jgi:peptidoglycan/LPS O-acetylase OafA/YrhL
MQPKEFYPQLESLRGIAVLVVFLWHAMYIGWSGVPSMPIGERLFALTWSFLFHGGAAVILFLVLSGFVLGINLEPKAALSLGQYGRFLVRRFFRLYPMVVVAALFGVAVWTHLGKTYTAADIVNFLLLRDISENAPLWGIQIGIAIGAIYPLAYLAVVFAGNGGRALLLASVVSCFFLGYGPGWLLPYAPPFMLGLLVPYFGRDLMLDLGWRRAALIFPLAFCIFSSGNIIGIYQLLPPTPPLLMQSIGAFYIVSFVMYWGNKVPWLLSTAPRFFGRISYSLYAIHFPIVVWTGEAFKNVSALPLKLSLILFVSMALSIAAAWIVASLIEHPLNRLGRKLTVEADPSSLVRAN